MARPIPSDEAVTYDASVTITFYFQLEADDDIMAEDLASYEWQDNLYHGEIDKIRVEMAEEDDSDEAVGGDEDE